MRYLGRALILTGILISLAACSNVHYGGAEPTADINLETWQIPKCSKWHGSIALTEPQQPDFNVGSVTAANPTLRYFMQKSGCFTVVDRGQAKNMLETEPNKDPNSVLIPTDYILTAHFIYQDVLSNDVSNNQSASRIWSFWTWSTGINTSLAESQTQVTVELLLTRADNGIQVGAELGHATKTDVSLSSFGGINNSFAASGKTATAALFDAFTRLIKNLEQDIKASDAKAKELKLLSKNFTPPLPNQPMNLVPKTVAKPKKHKPTNTKK